MKLEATLLVSISLLACSWISLADDSKFTPITPVSVTFPSLITEEQNATIKYWNDFSLTVSRAGGAQSGFAPESDSYYRSIYWSPAGIVFFCLALAFWIGFVSFIIGRFGLGYFGGRKDKKRKLTKFLKHGPIALFSIGAVIFLIGGPLQTTGTVLASRDLTPSAKALETSGQAFLYVMTRINLNLTMINKEMKHLTSNPAFLDYDPIGEETVLRASSTLKNTSSNFAKELRSRQRTNLTFSILFLVSGFIAIGLGIFGYVKKMSVIVLFTGVYMAALIGTGWFACTKYYQQQIYIADICNQVQTEMITGESPRFGSGISKYINCYDNDAKIVIGALKYNFLNGLYKMIDLWKYRANNTEGAVPQEVNAVVNITDIAKLLQKEPYKSGPFLKEMYDKALMPTHLALSNTIDLSSNQCRYFKEWVQKTQLTVCANQTHNWVGLAGAILVTLSFMFFTYALVAWKNVFERQREMRETMISRNDLNDI